MSKSNRQRRDNRARSIEAHKRGAPQSSPLWGARFDAWLAGQHRVAKVGKKSHRDLDRGHERVPATRERQYRCASPGRAPNPKLPAQQSRWERKPGVAKPWHAYKPTRIRRVMNRFLRRAA